MIVRLALVLLLASCTDGPHSPDCTGTCGSCASGTICFGGDGFFPAKCAKSCHSDDDCSGSDKCLAINGQPGPVCLSKSISACIGYTPNCGSSRTRCADLNTLSQLISPTTCAFEQITCPNGCDTDHCK